MNMTVYNPSDSRIGIFAHNRRVVVPPKNSVTVSEKMGKALLQKDQRLTQGITNFSADQVKQVDRIKKNALVVLAKSLMRGVPITPEEATLQADSLPRPGDEESEETTDEKPDEKPKEDQGDPALETPAA